MMLDPPTLVALASVLATTAVILCAAWYVYHLRFIPPECALVVLKKKGDQGVARVVLGSSSRAHTFVNPFTERHEVLDMHWRVLIFDIPKVVTSDGGRDVRFTVNIKLARYNLIPDPAVLKSVAGDLLGKGDSELDGIVRGAVEGAFRATLATRHPMAIARGDDRSAVSDLVREQVNGGLRARGIIVADVDWLFDDDDGYFDELRRARAVPTPR